MSITVDYRFLLLSLQRALLGAVHPQLRQASIEADTATTGPVLRLRFEYDGEPCEEARETCSIAATEVLADLAGPWALDEQHRAAPVAQPLSALAHVAFLRWEPALSQPTA